MRVGLDFRRRAANIHSVDFDTRLRQQPVKKLDPRLRQQPEVDNEPRKRLFVYVLFTFEPFRKLALVPRE